MKTYKGFPVAKPVFSDEDELSGIDVVSFVKNPAIVDKGIKLSEQFECIKLSEEKQQVLAPVLIPDIYIFRKTKKGEGYYLQFSKEDIVRLRNKWLKNPKSEAFNYNHDTNTAPSYLLESWIKEDLVYDKSVKYGLDQPVGTLYFLTQITDKDFWENKVKKEGLYGFSIEVYLDVEFLEGIDLEVEKVSMATDCNVHSDCYCQIVSGSWEFNSSGTADPGNESPCPMCVEAKQIWEETGEIRKYDELSAVCNCDSKPNPYKNLFKYLNK